MLRRKAKREHSAGLGAYVDRKGSEKKQKLSKEMGEESVEVKDEVEEKLGALVFGKQLPVSPGGGDSEELSSSEEEESEVSNKPLH